MKEEVYLLMSKISDFRKKLKSNPETAKLLMPGTKYEALLDLDGDGTAETLTLEGRSFTARRGEAPTPRSQAFARSRKNADISPS